MIKNRAIAILLALFLVASLTACIGSGDDTQNIPDDETTTTPDDLPPVEITDEPPPVPTSKYKVAFCTTFLAVELQQFLWDEFQRYAPDYGIEMQVFHAPGEPAVEAKNIEQSIADGYDAVIVVPQTPQEVNPALEKAKEAGLIVGLLFHDLSPENQHLYDFLIINDGYLGAKQAGEFIAAAYPNGVNVVEICANEDNEPQKERHAGFRAGIEGSKIEILDSRHCTHGWNTYEAMVIMKDYIVEYGNQIDVVFCQWDGGATGAIEALHNAGMFDVRVVGIDGTNAGYQQIKEGNQWLSVGTNYSEIVKQALENTKTLLEGGTVPKTTNFLRDTVTLENIDSFPWPTFYSPED